MVNITNTRLAALFFSQRYKLNYSKLLNSNSDKKVVFVHPPKTAGTSIARALAIEGPGHFTLQQHLDSRKVEVDKCVISVRDPLERLRSLFKYSRKESQQSFLSSLQGLRQFETFDEFVCSSMFKNYVQSHYFFRPQYYYALGVFELSMPKYFIRTEYFETDLEQAGIKGVIHTNASPEMEDGQLEISTKAARIAKKYYHSDYLFYSCVNSYIAKEGISTDEVDELNASVAVERLSRPQI